MQRAFLIFVFFVHGLFANAQQSYISINRQSLIKLDAQLNQLNNQTHTGVKPYLNSFITKDSISDEPEIVRKKYWLTRKLFQENLIVIDSGDYRFTIDPVFNFEFNKDVKDQIASTSNSLFYTNTRGFRAAGDIGKKFSFESSFYENQSVFVNYLSDYVNKFGVVPGQGRIKPFKITGFDYAIASGNVSYTPLKSMNIAFGNGKNFIGEGYRSLLLSDNAFNYPYLKITNSFFKKRVQYTNIYASLQSLERSAFANTPEALFIRKLVSFHYLSINIGKRLQIGLFESVIFKASDKSYSKSPSPLFYNPVMLVNSLVFANDTNNNAMSAVNIKFKPMNKVALYGQLALDNIGKQRYGYQLGVKLFDVFKLKNLALQAEYNTVTAGTYSFNNPLQGYTHYNQALAHPMGTGFMELVGIMNYSYKSFFTQVKINYAQSKRELGGVYQGYNIFQSDIPIYSSFAPLPEPEEIKVAYADVMVGYNINPKANMGISAGMTLRNYASASSGVQNQIFYLSFSSSILNRYYDF